MRKTNGQVTESDFGFPQHGLTFSGFAWWYGGLRSSAAWIKNATLRNHIIFGKEVDEAKYESTRDIHQIGIVRLRQVVEACCLEHDLQVLPHGEQTEIGEKGINLSGGQKVPFDNLASNLSDALLSTQTRVSLARAAYSTADIVLLDDPLSAVDAYVGNDILENCILSGPLARRTRIMTTHALHVLDKTDYIYVMDDGLIVTGHL